MAFDLKIEIFGFVFFNAVLLKMKMKKAENVPYVLDVYGDECTADDSYLEACDESIIKATLCRSNLLSRKYFQDIFFDEEIMNFKSLSEVYDYIIRMCDRDDFFGNLTVFERMLATSDFVADICILIHRENHILKDVLRYGHILWAMYFEKFTEEFYEKGGWSKLRQEIQCYELIFDMDLQYFQVIKEASVNYCHFKNAINYQELKHSHPGHISKLWINFRIENLKYYINIPLQYEFSVSASEAVLLMDEVKQILDPTRCSTGNLEILDKQGQGSMFSNGMPYSEIHSTSQGKKVCHKSSKNGEIESAKSIEDSSSSQLASPKRNENTISVGLPVLENSSSINNIDDEVSWLRTDQEELKMAEINTPRLLNPTQCNQDHLEISGKQPQSIRIPYSAVYSASQGRKAKHKVPKKGGIECSKSSKRNGKTTTDDLSTRKDFSSVNENTYIADEISRIRKAREELGKEQKSPEVKNFLRLILVLGDMEGTEYVLSTLQNFECSRYTQGSSNKQKKN